jgi:hypothetical protein
MGARKLTQDIGRTCSKRIAEICNNGGTFHNNTFSHVLSPMRKKGNIISDLSVICVSLRGTFRKHGELKYHCVDVKC